MFEDIQRQSAKSVPTIIFSILGAGFVGYMVGYLIYRAIWR